MIRRAELVQAIEALSREEALWQPSAAEWLRELDEKARADRAGDHGQSQEARLDEEPE
jgi:hypothetical protein